MARKRPNQTQKTERETRAFDMRARGLSLRSIARELGLSHERVRQILQVIDERELAALSEHYAGLKIAQNSRLETIVEQSFTSWFKSLEPQRRVRQTTNAEGEEVVVNDLVEQTGNVAYLDRARAALADQRSLWGLDVQAQEQEMDFNIASIARGIEAREEAYERRLATGEDPFAAPSALPPDVQQRPADDEQGGDGG